MFSYRRHKQKIKKQIPLQVQTQYSMEYKNRYTLKQILLLSFKRIWRFIFNRQGSMTVEAALVLPIFSFAITGVLALGQLFCVDGEIQRGLIETARHCAKQEFPAAGLLLANYTMKQYMDTEFLDQCSILKDGADGIRLFGSYYDSDEEVLYLKAMYETGVNLPFIGEFTYKRISQIQQRAFTGYQWKQAGENEEEDPYVYVTENRDVYHTNRGCTHLVLSVKQTYDVHTYWNGDSAYRPCERCSKYADKKPQVLYITEEGDRYHTSAQCSGLKRTVTRVKKSKTGGLPQCQRCIQKAG